MPPKKTGARAAPKPAPLDQHTERFRELLLEIGERVYGNKRGWQRRVGERFGLYPADVTRILKGERRVGLDVARRAAGAMGLDMRYFTGVGSFDNYVDLGPRGPSDPGATTPGRQWRDLRDDASDIARGFHRHEVGALKRTEVLAHDVLQSTPVRLARELIAAVGRPGDDLEIAYRLVHSVAYDADVSLEMARQWTEEMAKPTRPEEPDPSER